ncbi:hypothetical protein CDV31_013497 [Fusarium ambrosium]|uniref:Chromo shadow domain-containing protein n=1 Tax=Fusarium ambrosium TaxID=131363 RepID=A0A428T2R2_9HYPO|nr:hypothetical protein CDV31_013497 [Fusarium ambrosium]
MVRPLTGILTALTSVRETRHNLTSQGSRHNSLPNHVLGHEWRPPAGDWEEHILTIDGCDEDDTGTLVVYITWSGGQKTKHAASVVYRKCPQKVPQPLLALNSIP